MHSCFKYLLLLGFLVLVRQPVMATHLMGGELTYQYDGSISGGSFYNIRLIVYRYCDNSNGTPAPLDAEMKMGIYVKDTNNLASDSVIWFYTEVISLVSSTFVTAAQGNSNCPFQPTACIEQGEYFATILLPDNTDGYHLIVERCCRNGNIVNIANPGQAGMTFYAFIPPGIINSSPQISDISVPYICVGDTVTIINNAFDPDGDSLAYSFVVPYNGLSGSSNPLPDPLDNNPYPMPIEDVVYATGYSLTNVFGAGSYAYIDPVTGLTKYYIPNQGFYVAAIEIREYRNGVLISTIRRDLQFITIVCTPNTMPVFNAGPQGTTYSIPEGQTLCFFVNFTDPDGDSLYLTASGPLLDSNITSPPGTISPASGNGTVTTQFCWTPVCGMSRPAPYQFSVTVTDNGCPQKTTNLVFSVYVTAGASSLTPTVTVSQTPPGMMCQGTHATFHSNPTLSGPQPQFTWYVNGVIVPGATDSVYSPAVINNGDVVTVSMISNATCLVTNMATSPPFVVNVSSQPAPQVSITSNPANVLCPQQICLFTATVQNAGATPTYQWYINGSPSGTNQPLFTAANPAGIMTVYVMVTPSTGCPPENSNMIVFNIVPTLRPTISLTASLLDSICPGEEVVFNVNSSNTGNPPVYSWTVNGTPIGFSGTSLSLSNIADGDVVNVSVTSSYPCLSPAFTYADPLAYGIYPPLQGDLTDGPVEVCLGLSLPLEMTALGGKSSTYIYSWSGSSAGTPGITIYPVTSGYYYATVDDYCYLPVKDSIYIEVLPVPESRFTWTPDNPSIFFPEVQFIDESVNAVAWYWDLGEQFTSTEQNPAHEYVTTGIFPVELITVNDVGCTDTLVQKLEVENFITVYIPNSFTPNGDGVNDEFGMTGISTGGYFMRVFNRWGETVFTSKGAYDRWNGKTIKGADAPMGIYVYQVRALNDKTGKLFTGTVSLIR